MVDFGRRLRLETSTDAVGNVLIKKPATAGMEGRNTVVLQAHLDMVHQKNADTRFDFDSQGINMVEEGGWVKATGTTLGADNGIGVAAIMAVLSSGDIPHPPLEALFTIDEETGMTGAKGLQGGWLQGNILLNLDTENDDELDIGCAGGLDVTATMTYSEEVVSSAGFRFFQLSVSGLKGGHSGIDIHLGRANANKIIARLLFDQFELTGLRLLSLEGGGLRNAIPRESKALVAVPQDNVDAFSESIQRLTEEMKAEFSAKDPNLQILVQAGEPSNGFIPVVQQRLFCHTILGLHNGVYRMSPEIDDLVEASNNVARVEISGGQARMLCLVRSSVESTKTEVAKTLQAVFQLAGFSVQFSGDYPGWTPNIHSPLLALARKTYQQLRGAEPRVVACHAGLECGILAQNYPGMEMISFGPTIEGAHSPDERVHVASVGLFWEYFLALLRALP
jgi:dipeptidase D